MRPAKDTYTIVFRCENNPLPGLTRIRRLLKFAGRALDLTCIRINETTDQPVRIGDDLEGK